jgi:hypothetical protein
MAKSGTEDSFMEETPEVDWKKHKKRKRGRP